MLEKKLAWEKGSGDPKVNKLMVFIIVLFIKYY